MFKKLYNIFASTRMLIGLLMLLQLTMIIFIIISGSRYSVWIEYGLTVISILVVIHVCGRRGNSAYKLLWVIQISLFPIFGGLFYLIFNYQTSMDRFQKEFSQIEEKTKPLFLMTNNYFDYACKEALDCIPQIHYLEKFSGFPIYGRSTTKYLPQGELKYKSLIKSLEKAEKYIFLEYFIINEGVMWNSILNILKEKAKNGVDVRIIYDDAGCFFLLPKDYPKTLEACGIKCAIFNPIRPFLAAKLNNRDHRKIAIIDGKVAFTGGINLADEYINVINKRGHWKDSGIQVYGEAAWSFTIMFLQMWNICRKTDEDFTIFYPWQLKNCHIPNDGLVLPYADSPLDKERVGEHVYLHIINTAKKYIYINTPYLIIDDNMLQALELAAKSGIDVRIVTPQIGDSWYVHATTRSYYFELIQAGVKIYEYSNGYIHSKTFVSDDKVATVGTTNLDYRSLYLHFECGVWLYKSSAVMEIYDDFVKTLERCHQITEADCKSSRKAHLVQSILRIFAPLM